MEAPLNSGLPSLMGETLIALLKVRNLKPEELEKQLHEWGVRESRVFICTRMLYLFIPLGETSSVLFVACSVGCCAV